MASHQNNKIHLQKQRSNTKLERLIKYLEEGKCSEFTGYIKINFSQGHIARIEKFEEILKNTQPGEAGNEY